MLRPKLVQGICHHKNERILCSTSYGGFGTHEVLSPLLHDRYVYFVKNGGCSLVWNWRQVGVETELNARFNVSFRQVCKT